MFELTESVVPSGRVNSGRVKVHEVFGDHIKINETCTMEKCI